MKFHRALLAIATLPLLMSLPTTANGQDLLLMPKWKKGDLRTLYITENSRTTTNGEVAEEGNESLVAKARVADVQPERYMLNIEYRNEVLYQARRLSDKLGSDLDPWKNVLLRYTVDRSTGEMALFNWEEVRDAMHASFEQIKRSLRRNDPEVGTVVEALFGPLMEVYADKEMLVAQFSDQIEFIAFAFGKPLSMGTPLELVDRSPSPFREGDTLTSTIHVHLDGLDRDAGLATVRAEEVVDPELLKAFMADLTAQFAADLTKDSEGMILSEKEIKQHMANATMSLETEMLITVDLATTWPKRMVRTSHVTIKAAGHEQNRMLQLTVEVR
jgi:hypothetical protein